MRRFPVASAIVAVAALVVCAPSSASPQFHSSYGFKLTTSKAGASAGWSASLSLSDLGDPKKRPKVLSALRLKFPAGSSFDLRGHATCSSRLKPLNNKGAVGVCPAKTSYGSGNAGVIVGTTPLAFPIRSFNFQALGFDRQRRQLLLDVVLDPHNPALAFLISGYFSGSDLLFGLPLAAKDDIHTTLIRFGVPASQQGKRAFMRTPATCPRSRHWTASIVASFADHSKQTKTFRLPCRP